MKYNSMKTKRLLMATLMLAVVINVKAQEHKTYSGAFGYENGGTATYSYYEDEDGQRKFDGSYTYKKTDKRNGGSTYTETGQYKDDKLEGLWTLSFNGSMYGNKVIAKITINYKNGLLDGPMNYSWQETEDGKTTTKKYTLQFHEGYLTGKADKLIIDMNIFSYEFDENHLPNGLWTHKLNRPSEQYVKCLRYDHGTLLKCYLLNEATGDQSSLGVDDFQVGSQLLKAINSLFTQPYRYKEMPIRSSLNEEQIDWNNRSINSNGNKYGFLGYQNYGQTVTQ